MHDYIIHDIGKRKPARALLKVNEGFYANELCQQPKITFWITIVLTLER